MGRDTTKEPEDPAERIAREQMLRKLLNDRFDCCQCPYLKHRGRELISHCQRHVEELLAELSLSPKKPER